MSNINKNKPYLNLVTEHIELDKLLYNLSAKKQTYIKKLLFKRDSIRKSNKLFAEYRIYKINKKIDKIKNSK